MGEEIDLLRRRSLLSAHLRKLDSTLRRPPYPTGTATTSLFVKNLIRGSSSSTSDTHDIETVSQEGAALIAKLCKVPNFTSDIVSSLEAMNSRTSSFITPDDWTIRSKLTNEFFPRRHLIEASANVYFVSTQEILLQRSEDTTSSSILLLSFADAMLGLSHKVPLSVSAILFISNSAVNLTFHYLNDKTLKTMSAQNIAQSIAVKLRKEGHLVIVQLSS